MSKAKALPMTMLERVRRCTFCGRETTVSHLAHRENPLCGACLPDRMAQLSQSLGAVEWRLNGEYVEFSTVGDRTPR